VAAALVEDRRLGWAMVLGGAGYGLLCLAGGEWFRCPFRALTGLPCPGCGMTGACAAALRGDWRAVWQLNPFGPVFLLFWAVVGVGLVLPAAPRIRYTRVLGRLEAISRWPAWVLAGLLLYTLTRWFTIC
jgi:hypothetical protein